MRAGENGNTAIGVVGLWHLGCTIAACWAKQGKTVKAVDFNDEVVRELQNGQPPIFEPGLEEMIRAELRSGRLSFSSSVEHVGGCRFVFVAYDTPVHDDDSPDSTIIDEVIERIGPTLGSGAIVIVSAQLPAGTARRLRKRVKEFHQSIELVYSPENLRLGEALACYLRPGHIVIGSDDSAAAAVVEELFAPMEATCLKMNLPGAEMTKHAINAFLAASISLANQWADLSEVVGADFFQVAEAMKHDPRIGRRAYLTPGIGFSGATLGRDLQVLERLSREAGGRAPIFGTIWRYNKARVGIVRDRCQRILGTVAGKRIALLGMTYKPGTSTLRRSLPLEVAQDLLKHGAIVCAYDPKADWSEVVLPTGLEVCESAFEAAKDADMAILLTEWPELQSLDYGLLRDMMAQPIVFDTKHMLKDRHAELSALGYLVEIIGCP